MSADIFVLVDDYQYTTNDAINRTRIKSPGGAEWLTVPVLTKGLGRQRINEININNMVQWKERHMRTFAVNYCYAPYFEQFRDELFLVFEREWNQLVALNMTLIKFWARTLSIATPIVRSSDLLLSGKSNVRLYEMLEQMNCCTYLADTGFRSYLRHDEFERNGFSLEFVNYEQLTENYHQQFSAFVPGLSIVDLLFNEGLASIKYLKTAGMRCV